MDKKKKIWVIMGGPSSEHEISLHTAKNVIASLDPQKYLIKPVLVTRAGEWLGGSAFKPPLLHAAGKTKKRGPTPMKTGKRLCGGSNRPDVAFIAMHGTFGEDGTVQAILESAGIPYTGSGVLASALGMDKPRSLAIFKSVGMSVPDFCVVQSYQDSIPTARKLGWPLVTKPTNHGSSVGVNIVSGYKELKKGIAEAVKYSSRAMIQKFIRGREITCGILENKGRLQALPPTEIIPHKGKFYDYKSKYDEGGSEHLTPPPGLAPEILKKIQAAAALAHNSLGCSGFSRSDFILTPQNELYILEINTIPGMTKTSLLPQAARIAGVDFPRLLDMIIESALAKKSGR